MTNGDERRRHPSYGTIRVMRAQNSRGNRLFGSELSEHYTSISIEIGRAEEISSDTGTAYRQVESLIRVEMTAAQFAEMITSPNMGDVPCTISRFGGALVPREGAPPESKQERLKRKFAERTAAFRRELNQRRAAVDAILAKKTLSQQDRRDVANLLASVSQEVELNMPYFLEVYQEGCERMTAAAKAEVEAAMSMAVARAGLTALGQATELAPRELLAPAPAELAPRELPVYNDGAGGH